MPKRPDLATSSQLTAVLYTRVSRDRSRKRKSVREQDIEGREVGDREGWRIPDEGVFTDNSRSASRFSKRPRVGWDAVLAYLASNPVHVLLLWEVSRGDRRLGPWIALLDLCRDRDIKIHIIKDDETYDPADPRDRRYLAMEGIDAEGETEKISKRIKRDKRMSALEGRPPGKLNYGHRRIYSDTGHYRETVLDEHKAWVKRVLIDQAIIDGVDLQAITKNLNDRRLNARTEAFRDAWAAARSLLDAGERRATVRAIAANGRRWDSPDGGLWHASTVRRLALNPVYAGKRIHQGVVVGDGKWPVITDEKTLQLITARLTDPRRRTQRNTRLSYQLAAAATCLACGGLIRSGHAGEYRCAGCFKVTIRQVAADQLIDAMVTDRLRMKDAMRAFVAPANDGVARAIQDEIDILDGRLRDHYRESSAGRLSARGLGAVEADLLPQIEALRKRLNEAQKPAVLQGRDPERLAATWPDEPVAFRRAVILALAQLVLSPTRRGARATLWRFAESRWMSEAVTWGEMWARAGETP